MTHKRLTYIESVVLAGLVLLFATATYQRNFVWKDNFSLWSDIVKKSPNKARPYNNLANVWKKRGLIDQAILLAKKSIALNPNYALPYNNLGVCYLDKGWEDKATAEFKHAIRINPNLARARSNLGLAYRMLGQLDMAIAQHLQALKTDPRFVDAYNNLGICYFDKGWVDKAISQFKHAISINYNHVDAHYNLGIALASKGDPDGAIRHLSEVVRLSPDDNIPVCYNIACAYARQNKIEESIVWLKKAVDKGFKRWELLKTDKDMDNIRGSSYYKEIIEGLRD